MRFPGPGVVSDGARDGRLPRGVRGALRPAGSHGVARRRAWRENGDGFVVAAGDRRFEADNVVVATGVFQHDHRESPPSPPSSTRRSCSSTPPTTAAPSSCRMDRVLVVGAAHSGGDIAYEVARAGHRMILSGRDTGQIPFDIESRASRRSSSRCCASSLRAVLTVSTPLGRKAKPEIRSHGGPLLRVKRADLEAAGVERVFERTVGVAGREAGAGRRARRRRRERRLVHGLSQRLRLDPVPAAATPTVSRLRSAAPFPSPGLYFVGMPFLHSFSSMLILGAGRRRARREAHPRAPTTAAGGAPAARARPRSWRDRRSQA